MTRRLTLAILGTLAAALVLAGLGTLILSNLSTRRQVEDDLREDAQAIAAVLDLSGTPDGGRGDLDDRLAVVRDQLDFAGAGLVVIRPDDSTSPLVGTSVPEPLTLESLDPERLRTGETVSGRTSGVAFAATPVGPGEPRTNPAGAFAAVVLTREVDRLVAPAFGWFVIAGSATLVLGAVVAWRLGRRLSAPLNQATAAARQVADGDLDVRVPVDERRDDELSELGMAINTMTENLARSRGLEQQFLLSVSHDLRTPLTSIRGYSEAILDGTAGDDRAAASVIASESQRLERLVSDLLLLARLEARSFPLELVELDIGETVVQAAEAFRPTADAAGLELVVEAEGELHAVADADRLRQVVGNLLDNAARYASSTVRVRARRFDSSVLIEVVDDGPGIAPEDLPHVFERLYVARHKPRREESASGLGLAIVRDLVHAMGGTVGARVAESGGACLQMRLPVRSNRSAP